MSVLTEHFKSVADAIRAKKGTTDLIAPNDFAEEINNLPEGGGDSGGDIKLIYLDLSTMGGVSVEMARATFGVMNGLAKLDNSIVPAAGISTTVTSNVRAVALPLGMRTFVEGENDITVNEDALNSLFGEGWQDLQITKEQFYTLE